MCRSIHQLRDREEVAAVLREAREYVLEERTIEKGIARWREALN